MGDTISFDSFIQKRCNAVSENISST